MCSFKDYQKVVEVICVGIPRKKTNILSFNSLEVGAISACVQDDSFPSFDFLYLTSWLWTWRLRRPKKF